MELEIKGSVVFRHVAYPDCEKCEEMFLLIEIFLTILFPI